MHFISTYRKVVRYTQSFLFCFVIFGVVMISDVIRIVMRHFDLLKR